MSQELRAFLTLLLLSIAFAVAVYVALRHSLHELLRKTVKLEAGVTFYLRSFQLLILLSALSAAIGTSFSLKDSAFMEYVWKGAQGLSDTLEKMLWFVALYLVMITILVATLKIKDDK
jgi:preprotein translocase subunit SecG